MGLGGLKIKPLLPWFCAALVSALPMRLIAAEAKNESKIHSAEWWNTLAYQPSSQRSAAEDLRAREKIIDELLDFVHDTRFGQKLVKTALAKNPTFREHIALGDNSVTETVFSRSYVLETGREELVVENYLKLNERLSRRDLVWDLAHELTHFVYRRPPNPYAHNGTLTEFIREGIEGKGGELDAFESECLVSWELERKWRAPRHELCERYRKSEAKGGSRREFNRALARLDYYRVGPYEKQLARLRPHFPELSKAPVIFSSSLEKAPYPMALIREFSVVRKTACANNLRKQELIALQASRWKGDRSPSSAQENLLKERTKLTDFIRQNCRDHLE